MRHCDPAGTCTDGSSCATRHTSGHSGRPCREVLPNTIERTEFTMAQAKQRPGAERAIREPLELAGAPLSAGTCIA
jgi:hypothetical protein